jgi:asparagine synthase (glutamine-hydrolysing)
LFVSDGVASLDGHLDGYHPFRQHYEAVPHLDELSRFQYADAKVYLPDDILVKVDRMSMAHSLEVRVPLLDYRLVEFAFRLPESLKMPGLKLKYFLRQTMRGILPAAILNKRKGGFNVPMTRWLKTELRPLVDVYLSPETVRRQGYFRLEVVARLIADHMAGRADYSRNLWALLNFTLWHEMNQRRG